MDKIAVPCWKTRMTRLQHSRTGTNPRHTLIKELSQTCSQRDPYETKASRSRAKCNNNTPWIIDLCNSSHRNNSNSIPVDNRCPRDIEELLQVITATKRNRRMPNNSKASPWSTKSRTSSTVSGRSRANLRKLRVQRRRESGLTLKTITSSSSTN